MKSPITTLLAVVLVSLTALSAAEAGVTIVQKDTDKDSHKTRETTIYIEGDKLASRSKSGSGTIFDGSTQTSVFYDTKEGTYRKLTLEQAKAMVKYYKDTGEKIMREQLKKMPPAMRKKVEAQMAEEKEKPHYEKAGAPRKVGNWECTPVVRIAPSGRKDASMCVASYDELGIGPEDRKVLKSMNAFIAAMNEVGGMDAGGFGPEAQKEVGLQGLPIEEDNPNEKTTIVSIEHGAVPADAFKLPSGLKERKMPAH
jgi:hypothetical protein